MLEVILGVRKAKNGLNDLKSTPRNLWKPSFSRSYHLKKGVLGSSDAILGVRKSQNDVLTP